MVMEKTDDRVVSLLERGKPKVNPAQVIARKR